MAKRSYGQLCAVARGLDVLGERWTLLIVRELLFGPRRFGELLQALPGLGPNLLSTRLKALRDHRVVRRLALPRAGGGIGYELTDAGRALEGLLLEIARWELKWQQAPPGGAVGDVSALWAILALRARFRGGQGERGQASGPGEVYQLEVDDQAFVLQPSATGEVLEATAGRDAKAAVVVRTDAMTLARLALGSLSLESAVAAGHADVRGSPFAVARLAYVLALEGGSGLGG